MSKDPRISLSKAQIEESLDENLSFLRNSCDAFDKGVFWESKRIAGVLRTLLYDYGSSSVSIFSHLEIKSGKFNSTVEVIETGKLAKLSYWSGICSIAFVDGQMFFCPPLSKATYLAAIPFDDWWNQTILLGPDKTEISRGVLIQSVANQEAQHVADKIAPFLFKLRFENGPGWLMTSANSADEKPVGEGQVIGSSLRQIAHEIFTMLDPMYVDEGKGAFWTKGPDAGPAVYGIKITPL